MKGQNLRIKIGGKCIAFATSCTYHLSATLEDSSTKDDVGGFQTQEVTGMSGDISAEALYSVEEDSNAVNGVDALEMILEGKEVEVTFSPTGGDKNRGAASGVVYTCKAIVNDISVNAPNRQNVTYSIQMQMNSKPTKSSQGSSEPLE